MHRYPVDSTEVLPAQAGVSPCGWAPAQARLSAPRASGGESGRAGLCHVDGCAIRLVPQPAPTVALAERAAAAHYDREHYVAVPPWADDWQAAGRPRLDGWLDRWLAAHPDTPTLRGLDTARPRA